MASTSSASDSQREIARKTWELSNNMESVNSVDDVYRYDEKQQKDIQSAKPWDKEWATGTLKIWRVLILFTCFQSPLL